MTTVLSLSSHSSQRGASEFSGCSAKARIRRNMQCDSSRVHFDVSLAPQFHGLMRFPVSHQLAPILCYPLARYSSRSCIASGHTHTDTESERAKESHDRVWRDRVCTPGTREVIISGRVRAAVQRRRGRTRDGRESGRERLGAQGEAVAGRWTRERERAALVLRLARLFPGNTALLPSRSPLHRETERERHSQ